MKNVALGRFIFALMFQLCTVTVERKKIVDHVLKLHYSVGACNAFFCYELMPKYQTDQWPSWVKLGTGLATYIALNLTCLLYLLSDPNYMLTENFDSVLGIKKNAFWLYIFLHYLSILWLNQWVIVIDVEAAQSYF